MKLKMSYISDANLMIETYLEIYKRGSGRYFVEAVITRKNNSCQPKIVSRQTAVGTNNVRGPFLKPCDRSGAAPSASLKYTYRHRGYCSIAYCHSEAGAIGVLPLCGQN
jgi:hypothetical protein